MTTHKPMPQDETAMVHGQYRRSRGYWHRLFPVISLILIDVIFIVMLDRIFENSKDAVIRSDENYFARVYPHVTTINDDYNKHIDGLRSGESAEDYQRRFVDFFEENADRYISGSDFFYKITIIGIKGSVVFKRSNLPRFRHLNKWQNCFISRDFSRTVTLHRDIFPNNPERRERIITRIHYTSPRGWPEIRRLVLRFWIYAFAFVVTTAIFYLWLDRRMIRPLARVAGRLEQLAVEGMAQTIRQPRVDIEAAYNRLAETQKGLRLEMDLDHLIQRYQRGEDPFGEEMGVRLLRDTARAIAEAFSLRSVVVRVPPSEGDAWERVSTWPETSHSSPPEDLPSPLPSAPERLSATQQLPAWWFVPLRPEDDLVGVVYLLDGEEPTPIESIKHIQRLVENSLVRCAGFSRRLAEERNRFGINLATSMGHDLTNIIAGGKWDLNTIHRALGMGVVQPAPDKEDVFGQAVKGLKSNLQFLQEMVDIYRALGAARQPRYEHANVGKYLSEVCNLFSLSTSQRIELVQEIPAECEAMVEPRLLKMAVFNLLANSAHAIQRREDGLVGGRIAFCLSREDEDMVITIKDGGPGIRDHEGKLLDDREVSRIFQSSYSTKGSGGGLGLVWVKNIVEEFHQGTIRARNLPEGGAEIMIRFPRHSPQRTVTSDE